MAVATTRAPGAVADLCVDGHNAMVLSSHQPEEWATALTRLVEDGAAPRESLRGEGQTRGIARRWTIDHAADAMLAGLRLGAYANGREVRLRDTVRDASTVGDRREGRGQLVGTGG